jgi:hypothetical protein
MQMCKAKNASHIRTASTAAAEYPKPKQQTDVYTKYLTLPPNPSASSYDPLLSAKIVYTK